MRSQLLAVLGLAAGAQAHGYLSSPMSRTGLNAQVSYAPRSLQALPHLADMP